MKVAYVTPYYNGAVDGRYGRFLDWVHGLRDDPNPPFAFDVHALTASNPDGTLASAPYGLFGDGDSLWGSKRNKLEHACNLPRLIRGLRADEYDVVHVMVMDPLVFPTTIIASGSTPVVVGPDIAGWSPVRTVPYWEETRRDRLEHRAKYRLRRLLGGREWYDRAVAFSRHHRDILESFAVPGDVIDVLPPGVDPAFAPGEAPIGSPPELLYVGDFSEHKGYPTFLRAVARLETDVAVRVVGAGDPDRDLIADLGLTDVVTVEGFVPRPDLPPRYRAADLYVMPSVDETAGGNTQIEALASGLPAVVTDAPGVDEYAPADAKVSFAPRTVDALTDALRTALADLPALTDAARAHAGEFGPEAPIDALARTYDQVVDGA